MLFIIIYCIIIILLLVFIYTKISSRLEPAGLSRSDGKRPDGMSIVPWSSGRLLVWDATCPDTLAASYRGQATAEAGRVAAAAEDRKANKYIHLDSAYLFIPLAFETLGVFGPKTLAFVRELGRRISQETGGGRGKQASSCSACPWLCRREIQLRCWDPAGTPD